MSHTSRSRWSIAAGMAVVAIGAVWIASPGGVSSLSTPSPRETPDASPAPEERSDVAPAERAPRRIASPPARRPRVPGRPPRMVTTPLDRGVLAGHVVGARGRTLAGVRVSVGDRHTVTDEFGDFRFDGLASDEVAVTVVAEQHRETTARVTLPAPPIRIRLSASLQISGTVTFANGTPVPGLSVRATAVSRQRGTSPVTDDLGNFTIDGVSSGHHEIVTSAYLDGNVSGTPARMHRVRGGTHAIVLTMEPGAVIAGAVRGPLGESVPGAELVASVGSTRRARERYTSSTDESGAYRIVVRPGVVYSILVTCPTAGRSGFRYLSTARFGIELGTPRVDFDLKAGKEITGRVLDPVGRGVSDLSLRATRVRKASVHTVARTGPDGTFRFGGLPAGTYRIHIDRNDARSKTHMALGGSATRGGAANAEIRLVATSQIRGRLVDATGNAQAKRRVTFEHENSGHTWSVTADADGRFHTGRAPPGRCLVSVRRYAVSGTFEDVPCGAVTGGDDVDVTIDVAGRLR